MLTLLPSTFSRAALLSLAVSLAIIFRDIIDVSRLNVKAHEVISFKPKIDSPAVRDIKKEANKIIKTMR